MFEKYIKGFDSTEAIPGSADIIYGQNFVRKVAISYYNIVDSKLIKTELLNRYLGNVETGQNFTKSTQQLKTNFGVNEDVFNFFLQRRQMDIQ